MKIVDIKTYTLQTKLDGPFEWPTGRAYGRSCGVIKITTDDGIVGWGPGPDNIAGYEEKVKGVLLGRNPEHTWAIARDLKLGGWGFTSKAVQGAVDVALYDIRGKAVGKPIHDILGGALRHKIPTYSCVGYYPVPNENEMEWLRSEVQPRIDKGFKAFKMKTGGRDFAFDLERVDMVLDMIGPDRRLAIDATTGYTYAEARIVCHEMEKRNISWFEDPIPMEDIHGYKRLSDEFRLPISAHYAGDFNPDLCDEVIRMRAASIVHPSIEGGGGYSGAFPMMGKTALQGIIYEPSCWSTHLHMLATLHLLAIMPPLTLHMRDRPVSLEWDSTLNPLRSDSLLKTPLALNDEGTIDLPMEPGLGIDIDEAKIEKYAV
ncbi:mandelate racemase/muconate lactonizing enzyme family protein [Pontiella sulfatireligans]|uniref:D-galactarolactone cycloisomerase n=1 Tax=Pontiella sulfatireligans TaxID=2750658 RepID=A0A6C2UR18_9BACT|nr:mandelate racemase/muconate lactonizing enzyme family protein [Pontiella sulfatireligans]VGO22678.1 D-galactarolactone cycloisomerase [Pontiella sulfatireligans]